MLIYHDNEFDDDFLQSYKLNNYIIKGGKYYDMNTEITRENYTIDEIMKEAGKAYRQGNFNRAHALWDLLTVKEKAWWLFKDT